MYQCIPVGCNVGDECTYGSKQAYKKARTVTSQDTGLDICVVPLLDDFSP